jgi:hypothetical protein
VDPLGLAFELSAQEKYSLGAYVLDGFCGEGIDTGVLRDGSLYITRIAPTADGRYTYIALADIKSRFVRSLPTLPTFDLTTDRRDICLQTRYQGDVGSLVSNIVRVPRSMIDAALQSGIRAMPPVVLYRSEPGQP